MEALATVKPPPATAIDPKGGRIARVTGKNKVAIDAMVWGGLNRRAAAEKAGLTDHSLYVALSKPHCKAYYLAQLDVLRTSERARNIHTLAEVRDQTSNQMARVQAVKALEQIDGDETSGGNRSNSLPGLQIVIVQGQAAAPMATVGPIVDVTHD